MKELRLPTGLERRWETMGFLQLYIYRILDSKGAAFLEVMKEARKIYEFYGAGGEELFILDNTAGKYSLTGLWETIPASESEKIWIGLSQYESAAHCQEVLRKVDADPAIDLLYEKMIEIVGSASRILHGEFQHMPY